MNSDWYEYTFVSTSIHFNLYPSSVNGGMVMSSPQAPLQADCAHKLKILADSTRLAVLQMLMQRSMHVGEMNAVLGLEQSLLSHHLKVLRQEGLVTATRDGKAVLYHLAGQVQPADTRRTIDLGCCLLSFD